MANITKQQLREIIEKAPEGKSAKDIARALLDRGHTLEGFRPKRELKITTPTDFRTTTPSMMPGTGQQGFVSRFAEGVADPFLKLAATGASVARGTYKLGKAAYKKATGDVEGAMQAVIEAGEPVEIPLWGGKRPIDDTLEAIGVGAEIGSYFIGGSAVKGVWNLKTAVWQGVKLGAKMGAIDGALQSTGQVLQKEGEKANLASAMQITAGTGIGATIGAMVGGGMPLFKAIREWAKRGGKQFTAEVIEEAGTGLRKVKIEEVPLKSQPMDVRMAVKRGIGMPEANLMQNASEADKVIFRKMYELAEQGEKSLKITRRPVAEVGDTMLSRVKYINNVRQKTGRQLGELVESMPSDTLDVIPQHNGFLDELKRAGVKVKKEALDFSQSRWAGKKSGTIRSNLTQLYDDLKEEALSPQRIHTIRQRIFDDLQLGKQQKVISGYAETIMKKTDYSLSRVLEEISPQYRKLNAIYAQTSGSINGFYNLVGRKWSGQTDDLLSLRAGEVGQRVLGNASAQPLAVLEELERTAIENGFKARDSVLDQILFVDFLEDLFGTTQTRGLRGQVSRAGVEAAETFARGVEAVSGRPSGLLGLAEKAYQRVKKVTPKAQKEIVRKLIGF